MKYTVIVPVYDSEDTIGRCLTSIVDQVGATLNSDYSIILVDDGSTDRTVDIAAQFPIQIIRLEKNNGRIIARLTGALNAETDRILFVDSRVTIPRNTIVSLDSFGDVPAVIGELHSIETKYKTSFDTVFYLIRKKYYGKDNFPLQKDNLIIDESNFKRAPKGTALLLIDRSLFIKLTPDRTSKDVNDDTLLFHNLIFNNKTSLLRTKRLPFSYSQRTELRRFLPWLFDRGTRFADFYLAPGGCLHVHFLIVMNAILIALALVCFSLMYLPESVGSIVAIVLLAYAALVVYLSENVRDFITAGLLLPCIALIFGSGIIKFWIKYFLGGMREREII